MKRSGSADLPLHYGYVPIWLAERMAKLGLAIVENILIDYGKDDLLRRLSVLERLWGWTGIHRALLLRLWEL
jgi:hypothetical protein